VKKKIAVLGAGNGGQALSAHLAMMGNSVRLYELPDFADKLSPIQKAKGVKLTGAINGFGKLEAVTSNMKEALEGAKIVYIVVPSFGQMPIVAEAVPYLEEGSTVIFIPGNFGSLEAANYMGEKRTALNVTLGETDTLPYACRAVEPGVVNVWGLKKSIAVSAFPGERTNAMINDIQEYFPIPLRAAKNVLEIGFSNMNMIVHPTTVLLNAGRIESTGGDFRFYTDGVTPSVGKLQELMDKERLQIARAYGLNLLSAIEWIKTAYPVEGESIYELLAKNPVYAGHGSDAPKEIRHRYLTEDIPNLLVPLADFAETANVETPIIDSIITLCSALLDEPFKETGRNLKKLGLDGLEVKDLIRYIEKGY
jgi:opine dehydrogenase